MKEIAVRSAGSRALVLSAVVAAASMLMLMQLAPAFAVTRTYPPYSNCDFRNNGSGAVGGCSPGSGDLRAYSTANASGGSAVGVYMYGSAFSMLSGYTATLSGVSSSNVQVIMVLNSGDTSNDSHVSVYLSDPGCVNSWRCAYQGKVSGIFTKVQTTPGTFTTSGAKSGPNVSYSITTTSSNFRVVAYADATTAGTNGSYIDMRNSPYGAYGVSVTETN